jgi:prolyl 4-hydroxylase
MISRTSSNTWCQEECYRHPVTKQILEKIENMTGIPDSNSEYLQLLKYEEGQYYHSHHDFIDFHMTRQAGPRMITIFLYLNEPEAGGGTRFSSLDVAVEPKKGRALIWPSVHSDNPEVIDHRTVHEAQSVEKGIKYGANAW